MGTTFEHSVGAEIISTDNFTENQNTDNTKAFRLDGSEFTPGMQDSKSNGHVQRLSKESIGMAFPSDARHKLNRVLVTLQPRLATAKTDVEDLIARSDQEVTARQFLMIKVKDLEVELETTQLNCKENMHRAVLTEKARFTQMQWDMEELRRKCREVEMKLKFEQENKMLQHELDAAIEQLENLQKHHDDFEMKSKKDVKLLIEEARSLRDSQLEMKQAATWQSDERKIKCRDNRIVGLLLAEAQLLAQDIENAVIAVDESHETHSITAVMRTDDG
ncbi:hypothetical protein L6164_004506 [Bauhinia variegata]|uniref:Uncharacterized protein n=1 Tax=Bauhinia variegata TaxID=167791 RepID=A0ACB9Q656_BAUVA|nr:hypothetical protein L6164_004506 [Bauhinia variegata]